MVPQSLFRSGGECQMDGSHNDVRRAKKREQALKRRRQRWQGSWCLVFIVDPSVLYPDLFRADAPFSGCWDYQYQLLHPSLGIAFSCRALTSPRLQPLPMGQPAASGWLIWGNKSSNSFASIWVHLKGPSRLRVSAMGSWGLTCNCTAIQFATPPSAALLTSLELLSQDHSPIKLRHAISSLTIGF